MATNRIDILDPALLRPGRIDRKIEFPNPNEAARLDILKIHSRKMNLTRGIDLKKIADRMTNSSGAELKACCTEAGMFALRERRVHVTQEDFEMSVAKVGGCCPPAGFSNVFIKRLVTRRGIPPTNQVFTNKRLTSANRPAPRMSVSACSTPAPLAAHKPARSLITMIARTLWLHAWGLSCAPIPGLAKGTVLDQGGLRGIDDLFSFNYNIKLRDLGPPPPPPSPPPHPHPTDCPCLRVLCLPPPPPR